MRAKLVVVKGRADREEINLKLPMIIGRRRDADLVIVHHSVSRQHCELFELEGALIVRDNYSSNGTFVNNHRVTQSVIKPGDTVRVGPLTFRAEYPHDGQYPTLPGTDDAELAAEKAATPLIDEGSDVELEPWDEAAMGDGQHTTWPDSSDSPEANALEADVDLEPLEDEAPTIEETVDTFDDGDEDIFGVPADPEPKAAEQPAPGAAPDQPFFNYLSDEDTPGETPRDAFGEIEADSPEVEVAADDALEDVFDDDGDLVDPIEQADAEEALPIEQLPALEPFDTAGIESTPDPEAAVGADRPTAETPDIDFHFEDLAELDVEDSGPSDADAAGFMPLAPGSPLDQENSADQDVELSDFDLQGSEYAKTSPVDDPGDPADLGEPDDAPSTEDLHTLGASAAAEPVTSEKPDEPEDLAGLEELDPSEEQSEKTAWPNEVTPAYHTGGPPPSFRSDAADPPAPEAPAMADAAESDDANPFAFLEHSDDAAADPPGDDLAPLEDPYAGPQEETLEFGDEPAMDEATGEAPDWVPPAVSGPRSSPPEEEFAASEPFEAFSDPVEPIPAADAESVVEEGVSFEAATFESDEAGEADEEGNDFNLFESAENSAPTAGGNSAVEEVAEAEARDQDEAGVEDSEEADDGMDSFFASLAGEQPAEDLDLEDDGDPQVLEPDDDEEDDGEELVELSLDDLAPDSTIQSEAQFDEEGSNGPEELRFDDLID